MPYGLGGGHADAFADAIGKKTAIVYLRASAIGLVPPALLRHGYWAFGLNIELASVSVVTAARKRSGGLHLHSMAASRWCRMPQYGQGRAAARGQQGKKRVRQADGSTGGGAGRAGGWWPYIQCGGARTGAPGGQGRVRLAYVASPVDHARAVGPRCSSAHRRHGSLRADAPRRFPMREHDGTGGDPIRSKI